MMVRMVSALIRRALSRSFACMTLLLPFDTMASDVAAPASASASGQSRNGDGPDCGANCPAKPPVPAAQPSWQQAFEGFSLLLPKVPQMPSACRAARQYRSVSQDKMPRQPCFYT